MKAWGRVGPVPGPADPRGGAGSARTAQLSPSPCRHRCARRHWAWMAPASPLPRGLTMPLLTIPKKCMRGHTLQSYPWHVDGRPQNQTQSRTATTLRGSPRRPGPAVNVSARAVQSALWSPFTDVLTESQRLRDLPRVTANGNATCKASSSWPPRQAESLQS